MKLSFTFVAVAALALQAYANPLPTLGGDHPSVNATEDIFKRQSASRHCGNDAGPTYTVDEQKLAFTFGSALSDQGKTIRGANRDKMYPVYFGNGEGLEFPDCPGETTNFIEYPVYKNTKVFRDGRDPGKDRVVYKKKDGKFLYCGVMTHRLQPGNKFIECF